MNVKGALTRSTVEAPMASGKPGASTRVSAADAAERTGGSQKISGQDRTVQSSEEGGHRAANWGRRFCLGDSPGGYVRTAS